MEQIKTKKSSEVLSESMEKNDFEIPVILNSDNNAIGDDQLEKEALKEETRLGIKNSKEIPQPKFENINTVADFIDALEAKLIAIEDEGERMEIAYHIARIKGALAVVTTQPEKIEIGSVSGNELSMYDKARRMIKIDKDFLGNIDDYGKLLKIAVKEAEAAKVGLVDSGFQQILIEKSEGNTGEYHKKDKWSAKRIFGKWGKNDVLDLYNIKHPEKLADYFLEKEIGKRLNSGRELKADEVAPYLAVQFKKGAPKLYKKLKQQGYGFATRAKEIIINKR